MERKLVTAVAVAAVVVLSLWGVRQTLRSRAQGSVAQYVPVENRLKWFADQAKADGRNEVEVPAPNIEYGGTSPSTTLDKALSFYSLVIAQPIQQETFAGDDQIVTWYKFRILERLVTQEHPACKGCDPLAPPRELPLQSADEFVAAMIGGSVVIDGVTVSMASRLPKLKLGSSYLLFISKYTTGAAEIGAGPDGVFELDSNGNLRPLRKSSHPMHRDIERQLQNSLGRLRIYVQNRQPVLSP